MYMYIDIHVPFHHCYVRIILRRFCSKLGAQSELLLYAFKLPTCHATQSVLEVYSGTCSKFNFCIINYRGGSLGPSKSISSFSSPLSSKLMWAGGGNGRQYV